MLQELKIIANNKVTYFFFILIGILSIIQLSLLSTNLSKKYIFNNTDISIKTVTYDILELLNNNYLNNKQVSQIVSNLNNSNIILDNYNLDISEKPLPFCLDPYPKFNSIQEIKNHLENKNEEGFCFSYLINNNWLNYCAYPQNTILHRIQLLPLSNVIIIFFLLIYIQVMLKLIIPLKKFQKQALQAGLSLQYNPLNSNSIKIINQTASSLNYMQQKMVKALHDKTKILGFISHDLRTPLTRIRMRLEMQNFNCDKTYNDIEEMQCMISEILDYAKDNMSTKESQEKIDIICFLLDIFSSYEKMSKDIKIRISKEKINLSIKPLSLKRALTNILDNAFKYASQVTIVTENYDNEFIIIILDNGPGVPEDLINQLCKPFFQKDKKMSGVGLGLTIAQEIIANMSAKLLFKNNPEGGLCVKIIFKK